MKKTLANSEPSTHGPKRRRACRAAFPFQVRNAGAHSARAMWRHHALGLRVDEGNLNAAYRFFQSAKSSGLKVIGCRALYPASPKLQLPFWAGLPMRDDGKVDG